MSDSSTEKDEQHKGFGVEAEKSLLNRTSRSVTHFNARKAFRKAGLLIRSVRMFKLRVLAAAAHDLRQEEEDQQDEEEDRLINPSVEERDDKFDVEAQLLQEEARSPLLGIDADAQGTTDNFDARKAFRRLALCIHSAHLFRLRCRLEVNYPHHEPASPGSYTAITIPDHLDSEITEVDSVSMGSSTPESNARSSSTPHEHNITVLHEQQIKYVTNEIVRKKDLQALHDFGGVAVIAVALNSDLEAGISCPQQILQHESTQPCHQYLVTIFPSSFLAACNNYTIFLLFVAAALCIGFGIKESGWHLGWLPGTVLTSIILVIVLFTTIKNCLEEWSNKRLDNILRSKGGNMKVQVLREGFCRSLAESELEIGDIAFLRKGDYVPGDGIFVSGQSLEIVDDSVPEAITIDGEQPFLFYGSRVTNGIDARMLVISTRMDTVWGKMVMEEKKQPADSESKIELWIHKLNDCVYIFGILQAILILIIFFIRHELGKLDDGGVDRPDAKGKPIKVKTIPDAIRGILTGSRWTAKALTSIFSLSLLGIAEGLSFVISVATIVWSRAILAHKAMERDHLACLKMASVTTICVDKFGGMAEDVTEIGKFYVGDGFVIEKLEVASNVLEGLYDGIATLSLQELHSDCESKLLPLTSWADAQSGVRRESMSEQCRIVGTPPHNPFKECCQVVSEKSGSERFYVHCRGPLQEILPLCSHHYGINGEEKIMDGRKKRKLQKANEYMNTREAEVIFFACKTIEDSDEASHAPTNLIFLGMISIKEAKVEDTKKAISTLKQGGIRTILVSGKDIEELKNTGELCGIFTPGSDDLALTGKEFKDWSEDEKANNAEKIRIMGNCVPSDKIDLIKCLRKKDQVVAFLGQTTWDAPVLKQADIGLTNGTRSSTAARESCNITIWEDNCFSFLVYVIEKGRSYLGKIRSLVQLQVIFTSSSLLINLVAAVSLGDAPISTVQLFWLNLVVPLFGGLTLLLTGPSTKEEITTLTANSSKNLMTRAMWRNIAIQTCYQTTSILILLHKGQAILGISDDNLKSMAYNTFFQCQIFNTMIAREPEKKNTFSGLFLKNNWFGAGPILLFVCQGVFAWAEMGLGSSPELSWKLWGLCLLIGLGSWPADLAGKTVGFQC